MVLSKVMAVESGVGWRKSWAGFSCGVEDWVVADFGRG